VHNITVNLSHDKPKQCQRLCQQNRALTANLENNLQNPLQNHASDLNSRIVNAGRTKITASDIQLNYR